MAGLLRNMGVPGLVLSPGQREDFLTAEQAAELQRRVRELRGEKAGEALVVSSAVRVQPLAMSPEQLTLEKLRWTPEARICGALRLPALVVGLNVGDLTRTYANYRQARRSAYEDCILPMGRRFAATLEHALLPELGDPRRESLRWDTSRVAALREDQTELYRRLGMAVSAGWMRVDEARSLAGLSADGEAAARRGDRTWR
jgi:phage portal protein BeeE